MLNLREVRSGAILRRTRPNATCIIAPQERAMNCPTTNGITHKLNIDAIVGTYPMWDWKVGRLDGTGKPSVLVTRNWLKLWSD